MTHCIAILGDIERNTEKSNCIPFNCIIIFSQSVSGVRGDDEGSNCGFHVSIWHFTNKPGVPIQLMPIENSGLRLWVWLCNHTTHTHHTHAKIIRCNHAWIVWCLIFNASLTILNLCGRWAIFLASLLCSAACLCVHIILLAAIAVTAVKICLYSRVPDGGRLIKCATQFTI